MIAALLLATALMGPPAPPSTPPLDCLAAWQEVRESRRLMKNAAVGGGIILIAHMFDVATTAKFKHDYACKDTPQGQLCLVEDNEAFPVTAGLIAGKIAFVVVGTFIEYLIDKWKHGGWWPKASVGLAAAPGIYAGAHNIYLMSTIEETH